jgi:hypothetical protein
MFVDASVLNETPMLEQDGHFKHVTESLSEDGRELDGLIDWIIAKNKPANRWSTRYSP